MNEVTAIKICTKCQQDKSLAEFSFRKKEVGKRHAWCQPCMRKHNMSRYYSRHSYYKSHHQTLTEKSRQAKSQLLLTYLLEHPCLDCGESDPIVLEFDHRDGVEKIGSVTEMVCHNCSWPKIMAEIQKCDVRCANCHRRRTAKVRGYTRFLLLNLTESKISNL